MNSVCRRDANIKRRVLGLPSSARAFLGDKMDTDIGAILTNILATAISFGDRELAHEVLRELRSHGFTLFLGSDLEMQQWPPKTRHG